MTSKLVCWKKQTSSQRVRALSGTGSSLEFRTCFAREKNLLVFCHAVTYQSSMLTWQSGLSRWMIGCHHVASASWRLPLYLCRPLQLAVKIESRKPRFLAPRDKVLISLHHDLLLIEKSMLSCFFILGFVCVCLACTPVRLDLWDQGVEMNITHLLCYLKMNCDLHILFQKHTF